MKLMSSSLKNDEVQKREYRFTKGWKRLIENRSTNSDNWLQ